MNQLKNIIYLAWLVLGTLWCGQALAASSDAPYKIVVFAPQLDTYLVENDFSRLFQANLEEHWQDKSVELRSLPANGLHDPGVITKTLEELASDPLIRAVVASECPVGSIDGFARLRTRRPDILLIAMDPHEDLVMMSKVATLTLALNHQARGFFYPALAQRMGARSLIYFSFPRYLKIPDLARQHRIFQSVTRDMNMILVNDLTGPDPADPGVSPADIEKYLEYKMDRYLQQYGPDTAFVATSTSYTEALVPLAMRKGGNVLEAIMPSLLLGFPVALDIEENALALFGHWRKLLAVEDEKIMSMDLPGNYATWVYPYPQTAVLAITEIVISAIEEQTDIYDLQRLDATLEKYSPGVKWLVSLVADNEKESAFAQAVLLLQDTYWFGHGFQGFPLQKIPSRYLRMK